MAVGVLPAMQQSPHCCCCAESCPSEGCARTAEPCDGFACTAERILELERCCAKHAYNEEHAYLVLDQFQRKLRMQQEENASHIDAAQDVYRRVQRELEQSRQASEAVLARITAQNDEADRLHRRISELRAENAELTHMSASEEQAALSEAAEISASVHTIQSSIEAKRRNIEVLRQEQCEATLACEEVRAHLERLRKLDMRADVCEELLEGALLRSSQRILRAGFFRLIIAVRHSRRLREATSCIRGTMGRRQSRAVFALWRRWTDRSLSLREYLATAMCKRFSAVLRTWARNASMQRRQATRQPPPSEALLQQWRWESHRPLSATGRKSTLGLDAFSTIFARRSLIDRTFTGWLRISDSEKALHPLCRTASRLLQRRRLRHLFLVLVEAISRSWELRSRSSCFRRRRQLTRGWRKLVEVGSARRLQRRIAGACRRVVQRRLRGPGQEIFSAWHHRAVRERQLRKAVVHWQRQRQRERRRRLLYLGMALFRGLVQFGHTVLEFRYAVCLRYLTNLMKEVILPAWRSAVRTSFLQRQLQFSTEVSGMRRALHHWRSGVVEARRLSVACQRCAVACASRKRLAAWAAWQRQGRERRRIRSRYCLISARQRLVARQSAMAAWRSVLRTRARERLRSAADGLEIMWEPIGERAGALMATATDENFDRDLRWLAMVDDLQRLAREAAEGQVALEDVLSQGSTLARAHEAQRHATEALRVEICDLEAACQETSELASQQAALVEEELRRVLEEQADMRAELRRAGERVRCDSEASAAAQKRVAELEQSMEDSSRICADLVDDRGRRIAELERWSQTRRDEVVRLEEALEQQVAATHLRQAECSTGASGCGADAATTTPQPCDAVAPPLGAASPPAHPADSPPASTSQFAAEFVPRNVERGSDASSDDDVPAEESVNAVANALLAAAFPMDAADAARLDALAGAELYRRRSAAAAAAAAPNATERAAAASADEGSPRSAWEVASRTGAHVERFVRRGVEVLGQSRDTTGATLPSFEASVAAAHRWEAAATCWGPPGAGEPWEAPAATVTVSWGPCGHRVQLGPPGSDVTLDEPADD